MKAFALTCGLTATLATKIDRLLSHGLPMEIIAIMQEAGFTFTATTPWEDITTRMLLLFGPLPQSQQELLQSFLEVGQLAGEDVRDFYKRLVKAAAAAAQDAAKVKAQFMRGLSRVLARRLELMNTADLNTEALAQLVTSWQASDQSSIAFDAVKPAPSHLASGVSEAPLHHASARGQRQTRNRAFDQRRPSPSFRAENTDSGRPGYVCRICGIPGHRIDVHIGSPPHDLYLKMKEALKSTKYSSAVTSRESKDSPDQKPAVILTLIGGIAWNALLDPGSSYNILNEKCVPIEFRDKITACLCPNPLQADGVASIIFTGSVSLPVTIGPTTCTLHVMLAQTTIMPLIIGVTGLSEFRIFGFPLGPSIDVMGIPEPLVCASNAVCPVVSPNLTRAEDSVPIRVDHELLNGPTPGNDHQLNADNELPLSSECSVKTLLTEPCEEPTNTVSLNILDQAALEQHICEVHSTLLTAMSPHELRIQLSIPQSERLKSIVRKYPLALSSSEHQITRARVQPYRINVKKRVYAGQLPTVSTLNRATRRGVDNIRRI